ncbi:hypothetical protein [Nonomuraea sp. C10]|uniref:hypothetical protein n=1 Tax=Nonomuraea sp. C10 TaxID=2600577 RepID=UPI0011CDD9BF|nr:hypothetical protein [Nonomuraea sp. C10]TXK42194.1 hypothetical protein FR742_23820 [Nonomuraea sp. C10]
MLTESLVALAASGGAALVGAMATDAWQATRSGVARLFSRQGPERQAAVEAQLDGNVVLVERAGDPGQARQKLVPVWEMALAQLLEEHPEVEAELRELVARVREALPDAQRVQHQYNIARDNSRQFSVMDGDINYYASPAQPDRGADSSM